MGSRSALALLAALLVVVAVVPIAASRSARSAQEVYDDGVRSDRPVARAAVRGSSTDEDLLAVGSRSVLAGEQEGATRSLEFWARPRSSRARNRLSLEWDATEVRFRARLAARRFTHVVVEWGDAAIRLFYDGNLVDAVSVGAPSRVGEAHRVAVTGPVRPVDLRAVALYRRGLEIRSIRRHYRLGAGLFGRQLPKAAAETSFVRRAAVPGNTALPAITGTAKDGQTLTSTNGTWSGSPTSYTRAWQRCDSAGANCAAISGATATTYLVTSADVGKTIRVKVTATNSSGSGNATSAQTAVVTAAAPVNTALPAITGTAKDGQTLTSTTGTWTGTTPLSYARQWRRCDTAGANCTDISGATATTYTLVAADVGKTIKVVVTASNTAGNAPATSAATATVTAAVPANTALPAITGTAKEGQLLTASIGTWTGSATITYTYQWQTCNSSGASCTAISGATLSTYRLAASDVTKTVKVVVTATNGAGNAAATSAATAVITTGAPVNITLPATTGTATVGQTLSTANGTWAGTATINYTRQWKRCNSSGASCTAISGATGTTYTLVAADSGATIRVSWTATNGVGSATADTTQTALVTAAPPTNTVLPAITGTAKDGQTLTSTTGTWTGSPTYTRQWKRCDAAGANCTDISGATAATYVLTGDDINKTIKVSVTATNGAGSASADSSLTALVTGSAPVNSAVPTITGTAKDSQTLTAANGTWTGSATITYSREWRRCDTAGNNCVAIVDATGTTYAVTATDVGKKLRLAVTATNGVGAATAVSAATATVTALAPANTTVPTIGTAAKEGVRIIPEVGTWTGSAPLTYTYQWQRCDAAGANCAPQWPAATDSWYRPWSDDLGSTIRLKVTATNAAGSVSATTAATSVVVASPPVATTQAHPVIDPSTVPPELTVPGTLLSGMLLGRSGDTWEGSPGITQTMIWMDCDGQGENCTDVPGATRNTFRPGLDRVGQTMRFRMTATNAQGTNSYMSDPTPVIVDPTPVNVTPATIAGTPRNHLTVGVNPGTWSGPLPVNTREYWWLRCDANGEDCTSISEHTSDEHELTDADVGHRLRVEEAASYARPAGNGFGGIVAASQMGALSPVITDASTPPAVTIGGDLVADPEQWRDGDFYTLDVSAVAASDTSGLRSMAVMYDGQVLASYEGCSGAGCSVTHSLEVDTSDVADGKSSLFVVATDADRTQTTEQRTVRIDRQAPLSPSRPLVDLAPDGTAALSWQPSNSPDVDHYEILRRSSPEDAFAVIGTTQGESYVDQPSGTGARTAPLARMSAARIALTDDAPTGGEHVEYQVRAVDQAGGASGVSPTVEATATETPAPAPTDLSVAQSAPDSPAQITWDPAPGADRYAVYRTLDADPEMLSQNGGTAKIRGAAELIADVPAVVTDIQDTPETAGRYTYTVRSVSDTGQLGDISPLRSTDLQPTKVPPSQEVLDHARDIQALLEDGGAPARQRVPCTTKCKALRVGERALEKTGRSADKIVDQLTKLRVKVGSWPKLAKIGGAEATLLEQDFELGWEIGTRLRKAYFTEELPPGEPGAEIHGRELFHSGDVIGTWVCTPDYYGSACIGNGWTSIIGQMRAPASGGLVAVGRNAGGGQLLYETWKDDCSTSQPSPQLQEPLSGGWLWLSNTGPCPFFWNATDKHSIPFQRARLGTVVADPTDDRSESGTRIDTDNPGLSENEALQALLDALQNSSDQYTAFIAWLERQLGNETGTGGGTPDGTPSCTGATYAACVTKFQRAGFAGPFSHVVLEPEEAWIGLPGGAVVDTTPYADDEPDEDGAVIIRTNPDPMPAWTVEDTEIDQHIQENHDASPKRNEDLDNETLRKNAVRQCRIRVMKLNSGRTLSDCWTMPILITGGLDAHGPAVNDTEAVKDNARWIGLNRRPSPYPSNDAWYRDQSGPAAGCVPPNPYDKGECHEFPFWSTQQHWAKQATNRGPLALGRPYISWTERDENQRQGKVLQRFYGASDTDTFRFTGCEIPQTPDPATQLNDIERVAFPPTFLAIPVKIRLMPTFGICNDGHIVP
ncbi:hypothetical protein [Baekduia sp. Peel2402]|uniref:hypothetical protein n=1 Tax=Baekduia sp. Peel2402 TaxID=3458296 RepID=UPI00403E7ECE